MKQEKNKERELRTGIEDNSSPSCCCPMRRKPFIYLLVILTILFLAATIRRCTQSNEQERSHSGENKIAVTTSTSSKPSQHVTRRRVMCNKFKIVAAIQDSLVTCSLDTDLPDEAEVVVSIKRTYSKKGSPIKYSIPYYTQRSTVDAWRTANLVRLNEEEWKEKLHAVQKETSGSDTNSKINYPAPSITVSAIVPISQSFDSLLGKNNYKLTGTAVKGKHIKTLEDKLKISYPL